MFGKKKKQKILKHYSGEYSGTEFEIKKVKKPKSKVKFVYSDGYIGSRNLTKGHYKNLVKNSERLFDEKKKKYKRY